MVHTIAQQQGYLATFMPKPFAGLTGNGLHLHSSFWSADGEALFVDESDPRGLGLSKTGYNFVGGLLDHARMRLMARVGGRFKSAGSAATTSSNTIAAAIT